MDFMKLKASLALDSTEYEKGMYKAEGQARGFGSKFKTAMKVAAAATAAAATAVGVLAKKSVEAYAEFEQLAGGIKKLYGEAASDMYGYAQRAYKTAGMSANAYMQNVTGFSAALLNSVEGNSKEAARIADMAMQDIADNANTFGKYTVEELAGVYQALAKGQYQTLDNLMLGYGGSKAGMQSLIDKANELAKAQGMAGDLQIDSYADIVQAIHLVQGELNITGTTANEAASTIQGSLNMTKAAWQNLVIGFANPDADIAALMENLTTSATGMAQNLVPAIMQAINGISQGLGIALPQLLSTIPSVIKDMIVPLVATGAEMVGSIVKGIASAVPELVNVVTGLIDDLISSMDGVLPDLISQGLIWIEGFTGMLRENAGRLVDSGIELLLNLAQGIADAMPAIIQTVPTIISNIAGLINDNAPKLLGAALNIVVSIGEGLVKAIPTLVANIPQILMAIWDVFTAFNWLSLGTTLITAIKNGLTSAGEALPGALKNIGSKAWEALKNVKWGSVGQTIVKFVVSGIKGVVSLVPNALKSIGSAGMKAFTGIAWGNVGTNIVNGIKKGIIAAGAALFNAVRNLAKNALKAAKNALGIASPSKLFRDQVGKNISLGIAYGIEKNLPAVEGALGEINPTLMPSAIASFTAPNGGGANTEAGDININLSYNENNNATDMVRDLARGVRRLRMAGVV